jgi:phytoene/squalene synthetase
MSATPDSHSPRYFALLYASAAQGPALEALLGIEREVFSSLRPGLDHHVAHSRLQWWREECKRAADGHAVHPLTKALTAALNQTPVSEGICGIVDVAVWDLAGATFETRRELDAYCQRWATAMIEPLVGSTTPIDKGMAAWRAIGTAMREIELLANLALEAHHGRIRLPLDELGSAGVDTKVLIKLPWPDAVAQLLRVRFSNLRTDIERNVADLDREQQPTLRSLLVWAALAWRTSWRAECALPNRLQPGRFDGIGDAWFAWRMARRATVGRFRLS